MKYIFSLLHAADLKSKSHKKLYFYSHRGLVLVAGRTCLSVFSASRKMLKKIAQKHIFLHDLGFAAGSVCVCNSSGIVSFHLFVQVHFLVLEDFLFFCHNVVSRRPARIQLVYTQTPEWYLAWNKHWQYHEVHVCYGLLLISPYNHNILCTYFWMFSSHFFPLHSLFICVRVCVEKCVVSLTGWKSCTLQDFLLEPNPKLNQTWWQQPHIYIWPWVVV